MCDSYQKRYKGLPTLQYRHKVAGKKKNIKKTTVCWVAKEELKRHEK